jgi:hypothetical protein
MVRLACWNRASPHVLGWLQNSVALKAIPTATTSNRTPTPNVPTCHQNIPQVRRPSLSASSRRLSSLFWMFPLSECAFSISGVILCFTNIKQSIDDTPYAQSDGRHQAQPCDYDRAILPTAGCEAAVFDQLNSESQRSRCQGEDEIHRITHLRDRDPLPADEAPFGIRHMARNSRVWGCGEMKRSRS